MTWIEKESGGEEKWQKEEEAFVPPDNCSGLVYCNASQERYKWSRNIISCIWNTADNTVFLGPWGPLVLPLLWLPCRLSARTKNLDHVCTGIAYMPYKSSEDSSNQPNCPKGSPLIHTSYRTRDHICCLWLSHSLSWFWVPLWWFWVPPCRFWDPNR